MLENKKVKVIKKVYVNAIALTMVLSTILFINISYINLLIAFLIILLFVLTKQNISFRDIFLTKISHLKLITLALAYAFGIAIVVQLAIKPLIIWFTNIPFNFSAFDSVRGNLKALATTLFLGWFVGGLLEETIFRGFLLKSFEGLISKRIGLVIGVLFSSILFGFLHDYQGISGQILTGTIGFILAIIYLLNNKNLWLNVYIHGILNTISFLCIYYEFV